MRTLMFGLCALHAILMAGCGDDKNTTDSDTSAGVTAGASTSTGDATGTTGGGASETGVTEPTTAGATEATAATDATDATGTSDSSSTGGTTHTSHSSVTGESSSGADTSGTDSGDSSGTSGGVEPGDPATVQNDCAPNDGPALQFRFEVKEAMCGAPGKGEDLHLFLWQSGPLAPGSYPITQETGFASYQVGNNEPTNSVSGTLTIDSWDGDMVAGSYDLTFVDDSTREGTFAGPFCLVMMGCG